MRYLGKGRGEFGYTFSFCLHCVPLIETAGGLGCANACAQTCAQQKGPLQHTREMCVGCTTGILALLRTACLGEVLQKVF